MENKKHIISLENTEFNWFAFDLDWTLFNINKNINPFILNKIKNYLKLQVPIIFVTWRWIWTTNELIFNNNLNKYSDIYTSNYNWWVLIKIPKWAKDETSNIILNEKIFKNVKSVFNILYNNFKDILVKEEQQFKTKFNHYSITLVFTESEFEDKELRFSLVHEIEKILLKNWLNLQVLYTWHTIDIIPRHSGKWKSVNELEKIIWKSNFIRVWDQWNEYWNDFDMIWEWKWFTVKDWNSALKVLDINWEVLYYQDAINRIFETVRLNNSLKLDISFIDREQFELYKGFWDKVRKIINNEKNIYIENIFSFEWSITFNESEFKKVKNDYKFLEKYFSMYWWLYYSRNNFYHFFCEEKDNYSKFIYFINFVKQVSKDIDNLSKAKFDRNIFIAFIDIVKIQIIRLLQILSYLNTFYKSINLKDYLNNLRKNILEIEKVYSDLLENKINADNIKLYIYFPLDLENVIKNSFKIINKKENFIRWVPEANNPYFNYIYWKKVAKKIYEEYWDKKILYFFWLNYWWIELPYLVDNEIKKMWYNWKIVHVWVQYSHYTNNKVYNDTEIFDTEFNNWENAILFDDWSFTWESLFKVWDILIKNWFESIEYSILHIPSDRARQRYINNWWWLNNNFLDYLINWWIVRVWPFYKNSQKFNLEQERAKNINHIS